MSCCRRLCFPAIAGQFIHTKLWIVKEKKKQKKKYSSNSNIFNEIDNTNLKDVIKYPTCSNTCPLAASWFQSNSWGRFNLSLQAQNFIFLFLLDTQFYANRFSAVLCCCNFFSVDAGQFFDSNNFYKSIW